MVKKNNNLLILNFLNLLCFWLTLHFTSYLFRNHLPRWSHDSEALKQDANGHESAARPARQQQRVEQQQMKNLANVQPTLVRPFCRVIVCRVNYNLSREGQRLSSTNTFHVQNSQQVWKTEGVLDFQNHRTFDVLLHKILFLYENVLLRLKHVFFNRFSEQGLQRWHIF